MCSTCVWCVWLYSEEWRRSAGNKSISTAANILRRTQIIACFKWYVDELQYSEIGIFLNLHIVKQFWNVLGWSCWSPQGSPWSCVTRYVTHVQYITACTHTVTTCSLWNELLPSPNPPGLVGCITTRPRSLDNIPHWIFATSRNWRLELLSEDCGFPSETLS